MAIDLKQSGALYINGVLALYRSAKYFREKEVLATSFLEHSLEACRLISELDNCAYLNNDTLARTALRELSKALFSLKVMYADGIYPQRKVTPVEELGNELKLMVEPYVVRQAPAPVEPQEETGKRDGNEQLSLLTVTEVTNDGGFDEIYTGKLIG